MVEVPRETAKRPCVPTTATVARPRGALGVIHERQINRDEKQTWSGRSNTFNIAILVVKGSSLHYVVY